MQNIKISYYFTQEVLMFLHEAFAILLLLLLFFVLFLKQCQFLPSFTKHYSGSVQFLSSSWLATAKETLAHMNISVR